MIKFEELRLKICQTRLERALVERIMTTFLKTVALKGKDPTTMIYAFLVRPLDEECFVILINKMLEDKKCPFVASFASDHPSDPELRYLKICVPALQAVPPEDTFASEYAAYRATRVTKRTPG